MELALPQPKSIVRVSPWIPCPAIEELFPWFDREERKKIGDALLRPVRDRVLLMSGSLSNYLSKKLQDSAWGATAFTAASPLWFGLWTAALDDTFAGNTANEIVYTSYGRLSLTNNTTIFATGSGTTTYTKTFPSDGVKSFNTATGNGNSPVTYLGILDGNAGTSADKGYAWCSVTSTTINNGDTPQLAQNAISVVQD